MSQPKVSIVVPIYNVERYLRQCLDSIVNQTLKDIEIILVNDGSTDSSFSIMQEYAEKDSRIVLIDKPNGGYGHSMNCGFDKATGEYLGLVESDDYAELDMFEKLYDVASQDALDVVKAGFFYYYSTPAEKDIPAPIASAAMCSRVFCPATDFEAPMEMVEFFNIKPTIWSAIYRKHFIRENNIRFNETPGASYQDASFNFKVWACAQRVRLMEDCFLHYRQDNEASSIHSPGKVYCVCDEYAEMERFLNERPILKGKLEGIRLRLKYDTYNWNYERLSEELQKEFIHHAAKEFTADLLSGNCERKYYPRYKWSTLHQIANDPDGYHRMRCDTKREMPHLQPGYHETFLQRLIRLFKGGLRCLKEHGVIYTMSKVIEKFRRRNFI